MSASIPDRSITITTSSNQKVTFRPRQSLQGPYRLPSPKRTKTDKVLLQCRKTFGTKETFHFPRPQQSPPPPSPQSNKTRRLFKKIFGMNGKSKGRDKSPTKVVQTGEETFGSDDSAKSQKKGFINSVKALFHSVSDERSTSSEESSKAVGVQEGKNSQMSGCQGCLNGDRAGHINHVRGIYDRTGTVPTDEALLGTSPDSSTSKVHVPVKGGPKKRSKPASYAPEPPEKKTKRPGSNKLRKRKPQTSDKSSTLSSSVSSSASRKDAGEPQSAFPPTQKRIRRKKKFILDKTSHVTATDQQQTHTTTDQQSTRGSTHSKSWTKLPSVASFLQILPSAANQWKGNTAEPENADRIHVHSNSEESLVNISLETNATSANNLNNNQNIVIVENPEPDIDIFLALQEEGSRDLNEDTTDNMEIVYRPRHPAHVFATGCRGLSPNIIQPPPAVSESTKGDAFVTGCRELALNVAQTTSSTPLQSSVEWFLPEDNDEGTELYNSELVSSTYDPETVGTLAPNADHIPPPRLKSNVRYLEQALKDAMESPVPNIFPDEVEHYNNHDGGTTSNPRCVSYEQSAPSRLSTRISSLAAETSESNISSWSLIEKPVEDFGATDSAIDAESQNGSPGILSRAARALRVSSTPKKKHLKTSEVYQVERISNNSLTQEPVVLDITSTDEEFGFLPTLKTMPGAWPYVPDDDDEFPRSSKLDDMISYRTSLDGRSPEACEDSFLEEIEDVDNRYVPQTSNPRSRLMNQDASLSARNHAIPGAFEPHPSPAGSLPTQYLVHPIQTNSPSSQHAKLSSSRCSPPSSPIESYSFPVHLRGGAGSGGAGLSDIFMPAKRTSKYSKEEIKTAKKLLEEKMARWDCWVVGYQPKKGQTWKGFTKMTKERIDAEKIVKPAGRLAKFGAAVKELLADDVFSEDEAAKENKTPSDSEKN